MNEEVYRSKPKDDFDLFAELDAAYREDFLGERKGDGTGENTFTIKSTFEAVLVMIGLLIYVTTIFEIPVQIFTMIMP